MARTNTLKIWENYNCMEDAIMDRAFNWKMISNNASKPEGYKEIIQDAILEELTSIELDTIDALYNKKISFSDIAEIKKKSYSNIYAAEKRAMTKLGHKKYYDKVLALLKKDNKSMTNSVPPIIPTESKLDSLYNVIFNNAICTKLQAEPFGVLATEKPDDYRETINAIMLENLSPVQKAVVNGISKGEDVSDVAREMSLTKEQESSFFKDIFRIMSKFTDRILIGDTVATERYRKEMESKLTKEIDDIQIQISSMEKDLHILKNTLSHKKDELKNIANIAIHPTENLITDDAVIIPVNPEPKKVNGVDDADISILKKFINNNYIITGNKTDTIDVSSLYNKFFKTCKEMTIQQNELVFDIRTMYRLNRSTRIHDGKKIKILAGIKEKDD